VLLRTAVQKEHLDPQWMQRGQPETSNNTKLHSHILFGRSVEFGYAAVAYATGLEFSAGPPLLETR
jgi:hypothetical protein